MIYHMVAHLLKIDYSNVGNPNAIGEMSMKIKILGSGGGEGFPAAFCSCEHCETARKKGNKSLRTLSQTIINDDLLIDFPADTAAHCLYHGVNLGQLQNVLITHSHIDHFEPSLLAMRGGGFCHNMKYEDIFFYGPENLKQVCDRFSQTYTFHTAIRAYANNHWKLPGHCAKCIARTRPGQSELCHRTRRKMYPVSAG